MRRLKRFLKTAVAFCAMGAMCLNAHASTISELQEDKKEQEDKKAEAEALVDQLQAEQNNILDAIAALDAQVADYNTQIADLEVQKADLEVEISETEADLADAQEKEAEQYEAMKLHIQYSYENGNVDYIDTLFTSSDVSDIVNKSEYVEQIYNYDSNMLAELMDIRQTISEKQTQLEADLEEVKQIEEDVQENKEAVEIMISGKQTQVANYASSIEGYEEQIKQIEADIAATDAKIAEAEAEWERQQQAAAAAGQQVPIYYTGGKLQWPVSSGGTITSRFGPRVSPGGIGSTYHQGLDIACPTGTPILACESGTVIAASYSSSMGNYVSIAHGNGLTTTYMHNSSLAVSTGQQVTRGQVIAYAGSTGNSTGPHCHLGVRINGQYVDPEPYLY